MGICGTSEKDKQVIINQIKNDESGKPNRPPVKNSQKSSTKNSDKKIKRPSKKDLKLEKKDNYDCIQYDNQKTDPIIKYDKTDCCIEEVTSTSKQEKSKEREREKEKEKEKSNEIYLTRKKAKHFSSRFAVNNVNKEQHEERHNSHHLKLSENLESKNNFESCKSIIKNWEGHKNYNLEIEEEDEDADEEGKKKSLKKKRISFKFDTEPNKNDENEILRQRIKEKLRQKESESRPENMLILEKSEKSFSSISKKSKDNHSSQHNIIFENNSSGKSSFDEGNNKDKDQENASGNIFLFEEPDSEQEDKVKDLENNIHVLEEKYKSNKQLDQINLQQKVERSKLAHKTITVNKKDMQKMLNRASPERAESNTYFNRRSKKSTTIVEKLKFGSKIFKEEFNLRVGLRNVIIDSGVDPTKKYSVIKKIGDGSYGSVYLAKNLCTKTKVAMKRIQKIEENVIDDMEINNEIKILKNLDHPNIVKIYEFYESDEAYYIVTEYCQKGELYGYIKRRYTEEQLAVLFYQLFSGLCYLHEKNILHRDLKLENILIQEIEVDPETNLEYFWIKIIDFGTAKIFKKNKREKAVVGSSYYIAPEVLKQKYNEKCDIWSAGVILYMLIVGRAPFDGKDDEEIIESIRKGQFNSEHKRFTAVSYELQNLVFCLLEKNQEDRLSAREALEHPFFKKFNGRRLFAKLNQDEILPYIKNLFNYKFQSKLQQLVLTFLVHNLPMSEDSKVILKMFMYYNKSGNCKLTKDELTEGLCEFVDKDEVNKYVGDIILMLDGDHKGYIEFEEFYRACIDKKSILTDEYLKYCFEFLTQNNDGKLSAENIINFFVKDRSQLIEQIFINTINEVDHDHDGKITFDEFKGLMLDVR